MRNDSKHIIGRQSVEMNFESLDDAFGVQERIAELFYEKIQPRMETLFDEMFDKNRRVYIERIEIDCGTLHAANWEEEWVDTTLRKLKDQLRHADKKEKSIADRSTEFLFYLRHGHLPWNSRIDSPDTLENELIINESFISALRELISEYPISATRLGNKLSTGFINKIIEKLAAKSEGSSTIIGELIEQVHQQEGINKRMLPEAILIALSTSTRSREELKGMVLAKISRQQTDPDKLLPEKKDVKNARGKKEMDGIYINNAGLIILHPFLPQLFEQLNFTKEGKWIDEQMQHKAALVLEYLATGINETSEFDLPLPKIICGLDPETVITEDGIFEDDILDACDELIREIIVHWAALKNTGIESFRHTFLQRTGKLSIVDNGWLLQVEKQGVDILLGSLPWGIGVIRLPWMNTIIFTEWA